MGLGYVAGSALNVMENETVEALKISRDAIYAFDQPVFPIARAQTSNSLHFSAENHLATLVLPSETGEKGPLVSNFPCFQVA